MTLLLVIVGTHLIKPFHDLFPLWNELESTRTRSQLQGQFFTSQFQKAHFCTALLLEIRDKMSPPIPSWISLPPTVSTLACLLLRYNFTQIDRQHRQTKSFAFLIKHDEGIPLIMKAVMVPIPLQIIAHMDSEKLSAMPAYAKDPFFASLLSVSKTPASSDNKQKLSAVEANKIIVDIFRVALELQPNERLGALLKSVIVVVRYSLNPFYP